MNFRHYIGVALVLMLVLVSASAQYYYTDREVYLPDNITTEGWFLGDAKWGNLRGLPDCSAQNTWLQDNESCASIVQSVLNVNISNYWDSYDTAGDIGTSELNNDANFISSSAAAAAYVSRSDWTTNDDYPSACLLGTAVGGLGDTLTCYSVLNKTYADTLYQSSGTYVTSVTGNTPIVSSGGVTPTISLTQTGDILCSGIASCPSGANKLPGSVDVTITATEVDGSTTNEIQNLYSTISGDSGSAVAGSSTDTLTLGGAGSVGVVCENVGDSCTITGTDTTYTASGTLLDLTGTAFSVNEGTLTNTYICTFVSGTGLVCNTNPASLEPALTFGNGIDNTAQTVTVAGNTCLTQDADGLSVTANCIGNTQLEFDTGQDLTTGSSPTFTALTLGTNPVKGTGTLTDTKYCTWDSAGDEIDCNSEGGAGGGTSYADLAIIDGTGKQQTNVSVDSGNFDVTGAFTGTTVDATTDFTVGGTVLTDGKLTDTGIFEIVVDGNYMRFQDNIYYATGGYLQFAQETDSGTDLASFIARTTDTQILGFRNWNSSHPTNGGKKEIYTNSGDLTLDPAGNNVNPGSDSTDSLGGTGAVWAEGWFDGIFSDGDISLKTNGDSANYFDFSSDGTDLTIATTDGSDLTFDPDGRVITWYSDDDGAEGVLQQFYHDSASPAVGDYVAFYEFYGNDAGAAKERYGYMHSQIVLTTAGDEDGEITLGVVAGGSDEDAITINNDLTLRAVADDMFILAADLISIRPDGISSNDDAGRWGTTGAGAGTSYFPVTDGEGEIGRTGNRWGHIWYDSANSLWGIDDDGVWTHIHSEDGELVFDVLNESDLIESGIINISREFQEGFDTYSIKEYVELNPSRVKRSNPKKLEQDNEELLEDMEKIVDKMLSKGLIDNQDVSDMDFKKVKKEKPDKTKKALVKPNKNQEMVDCLAEGKGWSRNKCVVLSTTTTTTSIPTTTTLPELVTTTTLPEIGGDTNANSNHEIVIEGDSQTISTTTTTLNPWCWLWGCNN